MWESVHLQWFLLFLSVSFLLRLSSLANSPRAPRRSEGGSPIVRSTISPFPHFLQVLPLLECSGSWTGASLAGSGALFPDRLCLRDQTCSQIWSTVFKFGWSTNCMKSLYHSFWLMDCPWFVREWAGLRGTGTEGAEPAKGKISSVIARRVWVNHVPSHDTDTRHRLYARLALATGLAQSAKHGHLDEPAITHTHTHTHNNCINYQL